MFVIKNYIGSFKTKIEESNELEDKFIICTYNEISEYCYKDGHLETNEVNLSKQYDIKSRIRCGTALRINAENPYLKAYADSKKESTFIITGKI